MATQQAVTKEVAVDEVERGTSTKLSSDGSDDLNDPRLTQFTPEEQKRIIRRVDRRLVLTLGFLYTVSLMDRTNLGNAIVAGMGVDLQLVDSRYSIIVVVFFLTYVLLQPPSTVVIRKIGPRIFLPTITLLWGLTLLVFGFVREWTDMVALRLILGLFEAGFFPGCAYLLSCWYPRYDLQKRYAVFYLLGSCASAFAGILAYGCSELKNRGSGPDWWGQHYGPTAANPDAPSGILSGIAGWRYIFWIEGAITVVLALGSYITIVDFPELSATTSFGLKFLNQQEADFMVARIEHDRRDVTPEEFHLGAYLRNALDLKVWGFAVLYMLSTTCAYAIAYFLPIILNGDMGFSVAAAQCLTAPPYVLAAIVMYTVAWAGDKYHVRGPLMLLNTAILLIGLPLLGYAKNVGARYFGVFLATTGCNANIPCIMAWQANNIRGQWKRALCSATLVGFGGIGGIIGSTVFRQQDSPAYRPGMLTCIIAAALTAVITLALEFKFYRANRRVDAGGKCIENLEGFKYTL
ncbi:hypothetical protein G647_09041 [Cladophialophora carrionii CBS 160.54]|uniref:Major facilitator superfamily (MFS) profile domain-containing protein n=1 Tax=Cladophialophora carrionii CBS 160.54 TaxID=1279043 RepID=V9D052_9EURO|nr:uncharacterized protein G647_09041 [Cladophialophora carrionii CBS 160.54]ETI20026.1 hypothetical protein G647_09041 [Cladophialophora carrionii CBS 160.54]